MCKTDPFCLVVCEGCGRRFHTDSGLLLHQVSCALFKAEIERLAEYYSMILG